MNSMPLPPGENKANAIAAILLLAVVAAGAISASGAEDSASSGNAAATEGLPESRSTLAIHSM
ncbi:MAG: hypothetical protein LUQ10_02185, partial [Methanothrix sp.]|nr:hypothetical protein [Methanothrix sp.]